MPRIRTKVSAYRTGLLTERYHPQGNPNWQYGVPTLTTIVNEYSRMSDEVTPQFYSRIASGQVITNAMDFLYFHEKSDGSWVYSRRGGNGDYSYEVTGDGSLYDWAVQRHFAGDGGSIPVPSLVQRSSNVVARAKQKALAAVDSTPAALGEDIAEFSQTLALIRNPLSAIGSRTRIYSKQASLIRQSVHGRRADAMARDLFLTYQYGVAPLWRSVSSALAEISKPRVSQKNKLLSAHGSHSDSASFSGTLTRATGYTQPWSYSWSLESRATVLYRLNNPLEDWRSRFGLRNKDLPTILWEIQPYSFMLDRVLDIKSGIKGLMNLSDPSVVILREFCSNSNRERIIDTRTFEFVQPSGWTVHNVRYDRKVKETFKYSRALWSPSVADVIPRSDFRGLVNDASKVVELLSLIHSGLKLGNRL